jgi:hypothetical protein
MSAVNGHKGGVALLETLSVNELKRLERALGAAGPGKIDLEGLITELRVAPAPNLDAPGDASAWKAHLAENPFPIQVVCVTGLPGNSGTRVVYGARTREEAQAQADAQYRYRHLDDDAAPITASSEQRGADFGNRPVACRGTPARRDGAPSPRRKH